MGSDPATKSCVGVFAPLYPPAVRGGGPIRSIEALVTSSPEDVLPFVVTSDRDLGERSALQVVRNASLPMDEALVWYTTLSSPLALLRAFWNLRAMRPKILHFNSFFHPILTGLPLLLWRFGFWGTPVLLVAPRGEFGSGALGRRRWKKRVYIQVFLGLGLHRSVVWHSTAAHESEDIRRLWGQSARIIERENQTMLPSSSLRAVATSRGGPRLVYLGRIVEHKGLDIALEALKKVSREVALDIFGPTEDRDYMALCESVARTLPSNVRVAFRGAVQPHQVRRLLAEYDALVLPTAGENFGHVIAEALSVSCAVIVSDSTPWTEVIERGAGHIVRHRQPEAWAESLQRFAGLNAQERLQMREAAGAAYDAWMARPTNPHVWNLARLME